MHRTRIIAAMSLFVAAAFPNHATAQSPFVFRDVGDAAGLYPHVAGIAGHGAGWGDVDGDGWADLYVGTFGGHPYGSKATSGSWHAQIPDLENFIPVVVDDFHGDLPRFE